MRRALVCFRCGAVRWAGGACRPKVQAAAVGCEARRGAASVDVVSFDQRRCAQLRARSSSLVDRLAFASLVGACERRGEGSGAAAACAGQKPKAQAKEERTAQRARRKGRKRSRAQRFRTDKEERNNEAQKE